MTTLYLETGFNAVLFKAEAVEPTWRDFWLLELGYDWAADWTPQASIGYRNLDGATPEYHLTCWGGGAEDQVTVPCPASGVVRMDVAEAHGIWTITFRLDGAVVITQSSDQSGGWNWGAGGVYAVLGGGWGSSVPPSPSYQMCSTYADLNGVRNDWDTDIAPWTTTDRWGRDNSQFAPLIADGMLQSTGAFVIYGGGDQQRWYVYAYVPSTYLTEPPASAASPPIRGIGHRAGSVGPFHPGVIRGCRLS